MQNGQIGEWRVAVVRYYLYGSIPFHSLKQNNGGGQMVSRLAFNPDNPYSNPAEIYSS